VQIRDREGNERRKDIGGDRSRLRIPHDTAVDNSALPRFRYHPDPLASGSIKPDATTRCLVCGRNRGFIYQGPVFTESEDLDDRLCPWCISDGSAARKFAAEFTDSGAMDDVSDETRDEVSRRTPGFTGWQQERWLCCCRDAAAFIGPAGAAQLDRELSGAVRAVRMVLEDDYNLRGDDLEDFFASLSRDDYPTAYVFRCLHCAKYLAYIDEA
jgi:uncharacterized protein CbrC (UPF0167 family)